MTHVDVRKFEWLGSSGSDGVVLTVRADLPYKSFEELRKADREFVVGTTGPGSNAHDFPLLLKEFAGAKFKLVSGYPANSDILLAVERKEVDIWAAFAANRTPGGPTWVSTSPRPRSGLVAGIRSSAGG